MTTSDTISENELNELFIFMNSDPMNEFIYYADLAKWRAKIIILIPIRHRPVSYYSYSVKSAKITSFVGRNYRWKWPMWHAMSIQIGR